MSKCDAEAAIYDFTEGETWHYCKRYTGHIVSHECGCGEQWTQAGLKSARDSALSMLIEWARKRWRGAMDRLAGT